MFLFGHYNNIQSKRMAPIASGALWSALALYHQGVSKRSTPFLLSVNGMPFLLPCRLLPSLYLCLGLPSRLEVRQKTCMGMHRYIDNRVSFLLPCRLLHSLCLCLGLPSREELTQCMLLCVWVLAPPRSSRLCILRYILLNITEILTRFIDFLGWKWYRLIETQLQFNLVFALCLFRHVLQHIDFFIAITR